MVWLVLTVSRLLFAQKANPKTLGDLIPSRVLANRVRVSQHCPEVVVSYIAHRNVTSVSLWLAVSIHLRTNIPLVLVL